MKKKLLVLDDDTEYLDVLSQFLSVHYDVMATSDADDALALLGARKPDLILLDLVMPMVSGLAFLQRAAQYYPETVGTPVLIITGCKLGAVAAEVLSRLRMTGAVREMISKPCSLLLIRYRIRQALGFEGRTGS